MTPKTPSSDEVAIIVQIPGCPCPIFLIYEEEYSVYIKGTLWWTVEEFGIIAAACKKNPDHWQQAWRERAGALNLIIEEF